MTRVVTINGVDRTGVTRFPGSVPTSAAFDGEVGTGQLIIDDPDAALAFPPLKVVRWTEDASGGTKHLYRGRVIRKALDRGGDKADDARQFTIDISDSNWDLRRLRVHQWSRPAETGRARVVALGAYILNGASSTVTNASYRTTTDIDVTTYVPNTNTNLMDAKVYDATDPWAVIDECSRAEGKVFFIFTDDDGDQFLWYDVGTSTSYDSTLSITDDDPDLSTEFAPAPDGSPGEEDGSELLSGGALVPAGGIPSTVGETRPSIASAYDVAEETFYDSGADSDAASRLSVFLDEREDEEFRFRCYLDVPAEKAHLIKAGMTISFRWAAAGVTSPIVQRVVRCGVELWEPEWYRLHLELGFPEKLAARIRDYGKGEIIAGNPPSLSCVDTFSRTLVPGSWGTGEWGKTWTIDLDIGIGAGTPELAREQYYVNGGEGIYDTAKIVGAPTDTNTSAEVVGTWAIPARMEVVGTMFDHGHYAVLRDISWVSGATPVTDDRYRRMFRWTFGGVELTYYVAPITPDSSHARWQVWASAGEGFVSVYDNGDDPGAGYSLCGQWDVEMQTESGKYYDAPDVVVDQDLRIDAADSPATAWGGSILIGPTYYTARAWGPGGISDGVTVTETLGAPSQVSFVPVKTSDTSPIFELSVDMIRTSGPCVPSPEEFYDVGLGDGSTVIFFTPNPYAPGSLQVWVDGLEQTPAVTESDPATGEFTLSFAPGSTERITTEFRLAT